MVDRQGPPFGFGGTGERRMTAPRNMERAERADLALPVWVPWSWKPVYVRYRVVYWTPIG